MWLRKITCGDAEGMAGLGVGTGQDGGGEKQTAEGVTC